jgi:hypothetical protein
MTKDALLRMAGQAGLALLVLACLLASAGVAIFGVPAVSRGLAADESGGAGVRAAVYASLGVAALMLVAGFAVRGIWVLHRRGAAAVPPASGVDVRAR